MYKLFVTKNWSDDTRTVLSTDCETYLDAVKIGEEFIDDNYNIVIVKEK